MFDTDMRLRSATLQEEGKIHQLFRVPEVFENMADGKKPPPSIASAWVNSAAAHLAEYGGGLWVLVDGPDLFLRGLVRLSADDSGKLELTYLSCIPVRGALDLRPVWRIR